MKCRHCGKEYDDSFSYCPYCAEPKPIVEEEVTIDKMVEEHTRFVWIEGILIMIVAFIPVTILIYGGLVFLFITDTLASSQNAARETSIDPSWFEFGNVALWAGVICVLFGILYTLAWFFSPKRNKIIEVQHTQDPTSICPLCGSHSIALGRKGYRIRTRSNGVRFEIEVDIGNGYRRVIL